MSHLVAAGAMTLADLGAKSLLVAGGAWATNLALKKSPAALRHLVWLTALCVLLLLPALSLVVPAKPVPLLHTAAVGAQSEAPTSRVADLPISPEVLRKFSAESRIQTISTKSPVSPRHPVVAARMVRIGSLLAFAAVLVWAVGAAVFALQALWGLRSVAALKACSVHPGAGSELRIDGPRLSRTAGVKRFWELRLSTTPKPPAAMTWGLIRPVVLLPQVSETWPQERLEAVLLHELAHVRRFDSLSQLIAVATSALYWFNPAVWLCARAMRAEAESAADDAVLRLGIKPSDYARELLLIATDLGHRRQPFANIGVPVMKQSKIESRVQSILAPSARRRRGVTSLEAIAAIVIAFMAIVPLSSLRASLVSSARTRHGVPADPGQQTFDNLSNRAIAKAKSVYKHLSLHDQQRIREALHELYAQPVSQRSAGKIAKQEAMNAQVEALRAQSAQMRAELQIAKVQLAETQRQMAALQSSLRQLRDLRTRVRDISQTESDKNAQREQLQVDPFINRSAHNAIHAAKDAERIATDQRLQNLAQERLMTAEILKQHSVSIATEQAELARLELDLAKKRLASTDKLHRQGAATQQELDSATAAVDRAAAKFELAQQNLSDFKGH